LVIVTNADSWRADDATVLVEYLAAPNPSTCLALLGDGAVTPKLLAAIEHAGETLHFGPDPKLKRSERPKWFAQHVVAECERAGGKIAVGLARTVVERVGEDAMTLTQEAFKLARAAGNAPVDKALVDALVVAHPDAKTYELADALTAGQGRRVFDLLDELSVGDNPSEPIVIQSGLARHFRTIAAAQALGPRASAERLGELTGVKGYPATKALEQARALQEGAGARCVACLAALELDLRVSSLSQLGRSSDDGRRFVLERAARELLDLTKS
jgi:DNA polymerase III delta subunit